MSKNTEYTNAQFNEAKIKIKKIYEDILKHAGGGNEYESCSVVGGYHRPELMYKKNGMHHYVAQLQVQGSTGGYKVLAGMNFDVDNHPPLGKYVLNWTGSPIPQDYINRYGMPYVRIGMYSDGSISASWHFCDVIGLGTVEVIW